MRTIDIPEAVAERMRVDSSEEARKKLNDLGIDGTWLDPDTGHFHCKFRGQHRIDAVQCSPTGEEKPANIPIDGFILDSKDDWALVQWFIQSPNFGPN